MTAAAEIEILHPLALFRQRDGETLPYFEVIDPEAMPERYRTLLVHNGDMTSRLELFHQGDIVLSVLRRELSDDRYRREVVLRVETTGKPVEYGAIEIDLSIFQPVLREKVLEGRLPLGGLLNTFHFSYRSRPKAFIKLGPDAVMSSIFHKELTQEFYGRCNELLDENDRVFARIVELLRP
jgi:chorismate-pyruvate lyase